MRAKPSSCEGCSCYSHGTDFTTVTGQCSLKVMCVAEASGEMEAREGVPLVPFAPAGSLFERTLRRMSLSREQFAVTNVVRCRPKNNWLAGAPWEHSAITHCKGNLDAAVEKYQPKALFAMGDLPLRELTGLAGDKQGISHMRGYILPSRYGIPMIASWHPAFIRRGKAAYQGMFARDLHQAVLVAGGKRQDYIWDLEAARNDGTLRYETHPSVDAAEQFAQRVASNPAAVLSFDIETYESASLDEDARDGFADTTLRLIQFSLASGEAIAFPWENGYRRIAERILQSPNPKVGHNVWLFDNKVLEAAGLREGLSLLPRGEVHDTLQMFHHWQPDLPAHLQAAASFANFPFPWKHLQGADLALYGCVDVDATLRLFAMLRTTMERDGVWGTAGSSQGYVGQVMEVRPVLAEMERRGLPIDDARRLALDEEFRKVQEELDGELQAAYPDECRSVNPRRGKAGNYSFGYIKAPPSTDELVLRRFTEPGLDDGGNPVMVDVERWCRLEPFLPNSGPQVIAYMRAKGHKVPKSKSKEHEDGTPKDTAEKKELERLAARTGDGFYRKVIEYRELGKARGTYVEGFRPHSDGRVHTTFTFDTGIGQLSSRNPNIQNFPKHGRLARPLRAMVAAPQGMVLTEWDFKSCHVLTLGFLSEDPNYLRLARLDMHSFVTGHALKLWDGPTILRESDEELLARFKWLKANPEWKWVRDARVKHAILGIGNGLKAKGLFEKHPEDFGSQKIAQGFLNVCEELFPKVFAWQKRMQQLAHDQQYLKTQYGHIRRFYEVFVWDSRRGGWKGGDQAEMAISYWLSNIAFGYIREKLKALHRNGMAERYGLCNNVHDSFVFCFPEDRLEQHLADIRPVLVAPDPTLRHPVIAPEGLWIGVDCSVGRNWAAMEEVKLPKLEGMEMAKECVA